MAKNLFIDAKTRTGFLSALANGTVDSSAIAIIDDTDLFWALSKYRGWIPKGGHERLILTWKEDGRALWQDLSTAFSGLEEILAYGVEWNVNVADPHLTRIGNMSLHKTLPIQSLLKGCIAQKDKVIYWLDEDNWNGKAGTGKDLDISFTNDGRLRKWEKIDQTTIKMSLLEEADDWVRKSFSKIEEEHGRYVTIELDIVKTGGIIESIEGEPAVLLKNCHNVDEAIKDSSDIAIFLKSYEPARLDGYDGTVRVYCPSFYIKSQIIGDTRRVWISTVKIDNTWTYQPEILVDAYRSTVLNTVPTNMGYLSTLPVNSAISVVNTHDYCRGGGNRSSYDIYLETDPSRSDLCKPRTSISRAAMRTYSRNADSEMLSYDLYKNIFYWLYVIEYANFNCQEAYNEALTAEGYKQGGLGAGVTTIQSTHWKYYNDWYPLTPCGYCNELGNGTGLKTMTVITPKNLSGSTTLTYNFSVPRWRGFDNPFGDTLTNLDGIIIQGDAEGNPKTVYTTTDPNNYGDNESAKNAMEIAGHLIHQDGYIKEFDLGEAAHIIPESVGGDATKYKCDYYSAGSKNASLKTLVVDGLAADDVDAGLGCFYSHHDVSISFTNISFRSVSPFVSFSE